MVEAANRIAHYSFIIWGFGHVAWGIFNLHLWRNGASRYVFLGFGDYLWMGGFFVVTGLLILYAAPQVYEQVRSLSED